MRHSEDAERGVFHGRVTVRLDDPGAQYEADATAHRHVWHGVPGWSGTLRRVRGTPSLQPIKDIGHGRIDYAGESAPFHASMDPLFDPDDVDEVRFTGIGNPPAWLHDL